MHYTWYKKCDDPATHIELIEWDRSISKILVTPSICWLGIHFDKKLLFNHHVKKISTKDKAALGCIAMLSNMVWGLSHLNLCILYRTYILPIMTYASTVWWTKKDAHAKALSQIQNQTLQIICTVFKTTPIQALEIEAAIPPIHLHLDYLKRKAGIRLNRLSIANLVIHHLPTAWTQIENSAPRQETNPLPKESTQLICIAAHTAYTHKRIFPFLLLPWRKTCTDYPNRVTIEDKPAKKDKAVTEHLRYVSFLKTSPSYIIVYTDGSQRSIGWRFQRTGAAAVGFH